MLEDLERQNRLAGELESGERVLWSGRPDGSRWFCPQDAVLVPFSVIWSGIAISVELSSVQAPSSGGGASWLTGMPFVLIGLYLLVGRVPVRRWIRRRTLYALTDRRALMLVPSWRGGTHANSVWLRSYPPVDKRTARNGRGTLVIGSPRQNQSWFNSAASDPGWPGANKALGNAVVFADIAQADEVYGRLRHQLSTLHAERAT